MAVVEMSKKDSTAGGAAPKLLKVGNECIAKYDFDGSSQYDLAFKRGDLLKIVKATRDPNWYVAEKLSDGKKGMIPVTYVKENSKKAVQLQSMPWFHGKIVREDAEALLKPYDQGSFLVRESTHYVGDYTLCVAFDSKVEHYRVINHNTKVTVDEEIFFDTLTQLIEHYEEQPDGLCTQLTKPLAKVGGVNFEVPIQAFEEAGWTIKQKDLEFSEILGHGEFGEVRKGWYRGIKVAIKALKNANEGKYPIRNFLAEASVMTNLQNKNLVRLMGIHIDKTQDPAVVCLVTEFCAKGSLVDYLRSRGRAIITRADQFGFALDVSNGMAYLELRDLVHRDLAARNVLVHDDNCAKVSDFGLARPEMFKADSLGKIPIKWTAPEALRKQHFSSKSDVWSYGIFLWELYSFGRGPYPRVPLNDVTKYVEGGNRMENPDGCPPKMYQLMLSCWGQEPSDRPTFHNICENLAAHKEEVCMPAPPI